MRRLLPCVSLALILAACDSSGTSVYDANNNRVGSVRVDSANKAIVFDKSGNSIGEVDSQNVYDDDETRIGQVQTDGDIVDTNGYNKGKINGKRCENKDGYKAGMIAEDIDDEAAGGACLLLLLR